MEPTAVQLADPFARWWQSRLPQGESVRVVQISGAPSGFSNETWLVDVEWREAGMECRRHVVLRRQPQGKAFFSNYDLSLQFKIMRALHAAGIPVPEALAYEGDPTVLGAPFFVMEFVEGNVASGRRPGFHGHGLFFDASVEDRRTMWFGAVAAMARIHALDWRDLKVADLLGNPRNTQEAVSLQLAEVRGWYSEVVELGPFPILDQGFAWLRDHPVEYSSSSLLWGDARPGNIIYQDTWVGAVIDWEMAGIGPAEFDLAYFLLADEVTAELNGVPRLPGLPDRAETIAAWERHLGRKVEHFAAAEIFVATRFAVLVAMAVRLSPAGLADIRSLVTDNAPTRQLARLLNEH
jgi:aminoglycoside phosphotransferase (APT) family kinase protein